MIYFQMLTCRIINFLYDYFDGSFLQLHSPQYLLFWNILKYFFSNGMIPSSMTSTPISEVGTIGNTGTGCLSHSHLLLLGIFFAVGKEIFSAVHSPFYQ